MSDCNHCHGFDSEDCYVCGRSPALTGKGVPRPPQREGEPPHHGSGDIRTYNRTDRKHLPPAIQPPPDKPFPKPLAAQAAEPRPPSQGLPPEVAKVVSAARAVNAAGHGTDNGLMNVCPGPMLKERAELRNALDALDNAGPRPQAQPPGELADASPQSIYYAAKRIGDTHSEAIQAVWDHAQNEARVEIERMREAHPLPASVERVSDASRPITRREPADPPRIPVADCEPIADTIARQAVKERVVEAADWLDEQCGAKGWGCWPTRSTDTSHEEWEASAYAYNTSPVRVRGTCKQAKEALATRHGWVRALSQPGAKEGGEGG